MFDHTEREKDCSHENQHHPVPNTWRLQRDTELKDLHSLPLIIIKLQPLHPPLIFTLLRPLDIPRPLRQERDVASPAGPGRTRGAGGAGWEDFVEFGGGRHGGGIELGLEEKRGKDGLRG